MKNQKEIYEALLDGKTLVFLENEIIRLSSEGDIEVSHDDCKSWRKSSYSFVDPCDFEIYTPPKEPLKLEVECEWFKGALGSAIPNLIIRDIEPFIGKRTKMTLVEIIEGEK